MTLTLLLDLDDTLLTNPFEIFQTAYLKALAKHLSSRFPPETLVKTLMWATGQMIQNNRPDRTLEETFDASFYPALGVTRTDLQLDIDRFYADIFPSLRPLTSPKPEAIRLVNAAFEKGYHVAVATNPLFPRTAILQRLEWAGLPAEKYPFEVISAYESFHFSKPNPAYFAEILGQMGWPNGNIVMVGNSPSDDIAPASSLGLSTYYLFEDTQLSPNGSSQSNGKGPLEQILSWLERFEQSSYPVNPATPAALVNILRATPAALSSMTSALTAEAWTQQPAPGEWSLSEVICHLRDVDREVDFPRLEKIIQEDNPFISGEITDTWAEERQYYLQDGPQALHDFVQARMLLIGLMENIDADAWRRPARHAIFGPSVFEEMVRFMVTHDRTHLGQCYQLLHG